VLKTAKGVDQDKKPEELKGDFPKAYKEVNYIYGGLDSYESRRKQKLTAREVMAVSPATPEYLKWSEVPITFDRSDHPNFVPKSGRYPLIVSPTMASSPGFAAMASSAILISAAFSVANAAAETSPTVEADPMPPDLLGTIDAAIGSGYGTVAAPGAC
jgi:hypothetical protein